MDPTKADWLPEPLKIFLAVIFLIFLVVERVGGLRSTWINFRLGRDELSLEKQRLEIDKLRYEIEAIRKAHGLPEIPRTPMPTTEHRGLPAAREALPTQQPWGWQIRHPIAATILLRIGQYLLAFFGLVFGLTGFASPFLLLFDTGLRTSSGWPYMLFVWFLYLFLAYGSYRGYRRFQRSIVAIQARQKIATTNA